MKRSRGYFKAYFLPYTCAVVLGLFFVGRILGPDYLVDSYGIFPLVLSFVYPIIAFLVVGLIDDEIYQRIFKVPDFISVQPREGKTGIVSLNRKGIYRRRNARRLMALLFIVIFVFFAWLWNSLNFSNSNFTAMYFIFHAILKLSIAFCAGFLMRVK